jgi:hypothetical protein
MRLLFSRSGMELAVSTLVVMILGILIIGGGIILVGKISGGGIDVIDKVSNDQQRDLQAMLTSGQLVAVTPAHQNFAGKDLRFGLGISNHLGERTKFSISVTSAQGWGVNHLPDITINHTEQATAPIIITVPSDAPQGTYTFLVNVTHTADGEIALYDSTRFFTVRVQ